MLAFLEALTESVLSDVLSTFVGAFLALHAHHHLVKSQERKTASEERPQAEGPAPRHRTEPGESTADESSRR